MLPDEDEAATMHSGYVSTATGPSTSGSFTAGGRRAGRTAANASTYGADQHNIEDRPLHRPINAARVYSHMTLRFMTYGRFMYMAIYVGTLDLWFITGNGAWFGTNELTMAQMSEVLMRPSTSHIRVVSDVVPGREELI
jgi:hypothetical protein